MALVEALLLVVDQGKALPQRKEGLAVQVVRIQSIRSHLVHGHMALELVWETGDGMLLVRRLQT